MAQLCPGVFRWEHPSQAAKHGNETPACASSQLIDMAVQRLAIPT